VLAVMAERGLLGSFLGGVADLAAFENLVKIESVLRLAADPVRRLGALAARIPEDAERLWQRLRLSNAEHERIESMSEIWWRISPANENAARALLYRAGPARYVDRVLMAWVHSPEGARDAAWRALSALPERWSAPVFPIKAAELIARGVPHGPAVGIALRTAEDAWIEAGFPADQSTLTDIAAAATEAATRR
jgi:poly(A) polymerase